MHTVHISMIQEANWLTPGYLLDDSCVHLVITSWVSQFYLLDTAVFILLDTSWVPFWYSLVFQWNIHLYLISASWVRVPCAYHGCPWYTSWVYYGYICQSGKGRWWDKSGVDLCPSVCRPADTPYRGAGWGGRSSVSGGGYRRYRESWPDRVYLHSSSSNNLTVELTVCLFVHSFSFTEFVCQWYNFRRDSFFSLQIVLAFSRYLHWPESHQ